MRQVNSIQWHWVQSPKAFVFNWILPTIMMSISNAQPSCSQAYCNSQRSVLTQNVELKFNHLMEESHLDQKVNLVFSLRRGNLPKFLWRAHKYCSCKLQYTFELLNVSECVGTPILSLLFHKDLCCSFVSLSWLYWHLVIVGVFVKLTLGNSAHFICQ